MLIKLYLRAKFHPQFEGKVCLEFECHKSSLQTTAKFMVCALDNVHRKETVLQGQNVIIIFTLTALHVTCIIRSRLMIMWMVSQGNHRCHMPNQMYDVTVNDFN